MENEPKINPENLEKKLERERFEKIAVFIRHPSVRLEQALEAGDEETLWDELENKVLIERGAGHEMSKDFAQHLIREIPEIVKTEKGSRGYAIYSSPIHRAEALAKYTLINLESAHKNNPDIPLPESKLETTENFAEIPMAYKKGEILEILKKVKSEGRPTMSAMEDWFKSDPEFIASVFEKERQRVLDGLKKLEAESVPVSLIFTHRLVTGFILWLIEHQEEDRPITANDLPQIMDISRRLPYTSESEIGWKDGRWNILRKGDTPHLKDENLVKGTF